MIGRAISELGYRVQHVRNAQDRGELQNGDPKGVIVIISRLIAWAFIPRGWVNSMHSRSALIRPMESRSCQFSNSPVQITAMKPAKNFSEGLVLGQ